MEFTIDYLQALPTFLILYVSLDFGRVEQGLDEFFKKIEERIIGKYSVRSLANTYLQILNFANYWQFELHTLLALLLDQLIFDLLQRWTASLQHSKVLQYYTDGINSSLRVDDINNSLKLGFTLEWWFEDFLVE